MHKISVHAKIIQPGQKPKKLSLSQRFFFVHFPAFRTLFLGEQDNFIHLPADHAEKPLISVDFYRPKCVDLTFGDFLTIIILKQGDYLVVEKVKT